jgi:phosphoribosylformylglycinamidine cyclo-ligase
MTMIGRAGVAEAELRRTFNLGLGMIIVVPAEAEPAALAALAPHGGRVVGHLVPRAGGAASRMVGG